MLLQKLLQIKIEAISVLRSFTTEKSTFCNARNIIICKLIYHAIRYYFYCGEQYQYRPFVVRYVWLLKDTLFIFQKYSILFERIYIINNHYINYFKNKTYSLTFERYITQ